MKNGGFWMLKKIYSVMLLVCVCLLFLCSNSYANGVKIEEDEVYEDFYSFLSDLYDLLGIGG